MMTKKCAWSFVFGFWAISGCAPAMPQIHRQIILEKAPADLECTRERIHIQPRDGEKNVYAVHGCNAKAAYRVVCNERNECEAVLVEVPRPVLPPESPRPKEKEEE